MIAENSDNRIILHSIKYHLLKIDSLYAALINESLNIISKLNEKDSLNVIKLYCHQHVFLEQIASHRVGITALCKQLPLKRFNYYRLQSMFLKGDLVAIDTLMRCISEKIGFMVGIDSDSIKKHRINLKWHYKLLLEHKKEQDNYFRKPIWQLF